MATAVAPVISPKEDLPPPLTSASEPPPLFDGTTRLYLAYHCPYAQRAWIARNCKGLQDKIKVVAIDLADRPAWYKGKVYPDNKVPALEHNNQVKGDVTPWVSWNNPAATADFTAVGFDYFVDDPAPPIELPGESLDLVKYIDNNFDGPALLPDDSAKKQFAEELLAFSDGFNSAFFSCLRSKGDVSDAAAAAVDKIEAALGKFSDGPFFLGEFSLVDIAYVPFIERFQIFYSGIKKDELAKGRPNLHKFIEEVNKVDGYTQTKLDPQYLLDQMKEKFGIA